MIGYHAVLLRLQVLIFGPLIVLVRYRIEGRVPRSWGVFLARIIGTRLRLGGWAVTGFVPEEAIRKEEIVSVSVPQRVHSVFAAACPVAKVRPERNSRFVLRTQPTPHLQMRQLERVEGTLRHPHIPVQL